MTGYSNWQRDSSNHLHDDVEQLRSLAKRTEKGCLGLQQVAMANVPPGRTGVTDAVDSLINRHLRRRSESWP